VTATSVAQRSLSAAFAPAGGEPAWLAEARRAALARLDAAGLPTARHEDWRFTSLVGLGAVAFARADAAAADDSAAAALLERAPVPEGPRLVFVNGTFRPSLSRPGPLPRRGVVLSTLAEAIAQAPEKVRPHLGRLADAGKHAFVAANTALFGDGAFLWLPRAVEVDVPISIVHLALPSGPTQAHPRTLVVAEEGARATLEELFLGPGTEAYLTNAVTELVLGEGAQLEHVRLQEEGAKAFHVGVVAAEQAAGASLAAHAFSLGAQLARSEVWSRLVGEGARCAANGLSMADGTRLADAFTWVEHAAPRCTTTETYKGILDGHARGVFSGRIRVEPGAQKTVAHQLTSSLLLSEDAVVDAKPQLEIFADDVKCGHGGTVGQLDEAALFYLRSRGVPEADAQSLLIWAFAAEMVGLVGAPALRARAKNLVAARLPAGGHVLEAA
jgi:Fe-S cluster assembly protein SufD